ncbi:SpvB/TcaC N-terminal domain-containing protein [Enterobacter bugandensis]|uniref:SpvB/TcaC N-terminal domain-containing protein n=1 Tax=Enterobacter bugandensis TaxID=881260 RepID=UPI0009ECEEFA|nr:SpvB/TcaC N-terminal domain-containing protein [Enterobacter bugandensis]
MSEKPGIDSLSPQLPQGGGVISGMGESLGAPGAWGVPEYSIPFPVSPARYLEPELILTYNSITGNGPFGLGWNCNLSFVSRSVSDGVPDYTDNDVFLSLGGIRLIKCTDNTPFSDYGLFGDKGGLPDPGNYTVTCYQEQVASSFSRYEHWSEKSDNERNDFWVVRSPDGNIHLLGKNKTACLSDPLDKKRIARWYLEETLSPLGETIFYQYRKEDGINCDETELAAHPSEGAAVYPYRIYYGNCTDVNSLVSFSNLKPKWLFRIDFDYITDNNIWSVRKDCFSDFRYGFNVRTRRLCRQIILLHEVTLLAGEYSNTEDFQPVTTLHFDYEHHSSVTTLVSVWQSALDNSDRELSIPPLEFSYQSPEDLSGRTWTPFHEPEKYNTQQFYQMVDLLGEGIAGFLYKDSHAWWYREPVRNVHKDDPDAITWSSPRLLPAIPLSREEGMLRDINGDGRLEWLITRPGSQGYYTFIAPGDWGEFIPLQALPVEINHPSSWLADITGNGLLDLILLGPESVRLYPGKEQGWGKLREIFQESNIELPAFTVAKRELVLLADVAGSGQQHLVQINARGVRYWPNLGGGRFGNVISIPGFAREERDFDPGRVLIADIDGSGSADIIYANAGHIDIYINQSGNRFSDPVSLFLPPDIHYDHTCHLQVADTNGTGVGSLMLTVPHPTPRHFIFNFSSKKTWLMNRINNNRGADIRFTYRSSVQGWLDEKLQSETQGHYRYSMLPFPVQTLWQILSTDEITGHSLTSVIRYYGGVWDKKEKKFNGFRRVEITDTEIISSFPTQKKINPPAVTTINWYLTGEPLADALSSEEFWMDDGERWPVSPLLITAYDELAEMDIEYSPVSDEECYWLYRALSGRPMRTEIYAENVPELPWRVQQNRWQVRSINVGNKIPVALAIPLETMDYFYEGIISDPVCRQNITMRVDFWGSQVESMSINYPRRSTIKMSDYPPELLEGIVQNSIDSQQNRIFIQRQRNSWYYVYDSCFWRAGLTKVLRVDIFETDSDLLPEMGYRFEYFRSKPGWKEGFTRELLTQKIFVYTGTNGEPNATGLLDRTLTSAFDRTTMASLEIQLEPDDIVSLLHQGGYCRVSHELCDEEASGVLWATTKLYPDYGSRRTFYRPRSVSFPLLTGQEQLIWDEKGFFLRWMKGVDGSEVSICHDPRTLKPTCIHDRNDNIHLVDFDIAGRVSSARFRGTEEGQSTGYSSRTFIVPSTVEKALEITSGQPVSGFCLYFSTSWLDGIKNLYHRMYDSDLPAGRGVLWLSKITRDRGFSSTELQMALKNLERQPPHTLQCVVEGYDDGSEQRFRYSVTFSDGFGRLLQTSVQTEPGLAWKLSKNGHLGTIQESSEKRWIVSGKTEYDSKGNPIKQYNPYFVDSWKWVTDNSHEGKQTVDCHVYDAFNREIAVHTASGYLRRRHYFPWFVISEDENDTSYALAEESVPPVIES